MLEIINYNTAPILQIRNATYPFAVTTIATIAILRTTEPSYNGQIITLLGHTTAGVGSGQFRYDASDTTTADDNSNVIVTTTGGKRWKRIMLAYDYEQFTASSTATSMASPLVLRDFVERKLCLDFTNPTLDGTVNMSSRIQSLLNAAGADTRKGRREVVIQGKGSNNYVGIGTQLLIPSDVRLVFDGDVTCLPLNQNQYGIKSDADYPTTWVNLSADRLKGSASITVTDGSSFNVGDEVIIKSNKRIDNCPNSYDAKIGQQCTIWRKETNVLHLDTCLRYDYLVSDTAQIGKIINPKKNIIIENFRYGEDGRTIRGGNAVSLNYVDGFKIIGTQIRNMRLDDNLDNSAKNGIGITGGRNGIISETILNRVGWYGITYQGCAENLIIEKLTSHWARHHISANWANVDHQPMDITVRDATGTFSTLSGFDTHDVGLNTLYERVISTGSQADCGFQNRCNSIKYKYCEAYNNYFDGFVGRGLINKGYFDYCIANNNLRTGINYGSTGADLHECITNDNGSAGRDLSSGVNFGGESKNNYYAVTADYSATDTNDLIIENLDMPYSTNQVIGVQFITNNFGHKFYFRNNNCVGYGDFLFSIPTGQQALYYPRTNGRNKLREHTTGGETFGVVPFASAGNLTVNTTSIRRLWSTATGTRGRHVSEIKLTVIEASVPVSVSSRIITGGTSFQITASDACTVRWEITGV